MKKQLLENEIFGIGKRTVENAEEHNVGHGL
ncbi:hypothetical protein HDC92_004296 [Pedobacter sp. AK017]|nr:hypothetical protein [Pedobacter sp. AK017]